MKECGSRMQPHFPNLLDTLRHAHSLFGQEECPAMKHVLRPFAFSLLLTAHAMAQATVTRNVNLRSDASTSSEVVEKLKSGTQLQLVEPDKTNGFYNVTAPDGQDGWVWSHYVKLLESTPSPTSTPTSTPQADFSSQLMSARKPGSGQPLIESGSEVCGPTGDATNSTAIALNNSKNRTDVPGDSDYIDIGWSDLANLPSDRANDFVGVPVRVVGFLSHKINVENTGSGESTNCHLLGDSEVDWHIYLTHSPAQPISQAIIVETTPRTRPQHKWTTDLLNALVNSQTQVRISGWLMYESEHVGAIGAQRATVWEVHPITKIEVQSDGTWIDLDSQP